MIGIKAVGNPIRVTLRMPAGVHSALALGAIVRLSELTVGVSVGTLEDELDCVNSSFGNEDRGVTVWHVCRWKTVKKGGGAGKQRVSKGGGELTRKTRTHPEKNFGTFRRMLMMTH